MKNKSYLFHTRILDLTGGSKSILNIATGLIKVGNKVTIILEKQLIRYSIPQHIDIYVITLSGIKKLDTKLFTIVNPKNEVNHQRMNLKNKILRIKSIRYILIWIRYIFNLLQFPIKNYHMKKFLNQNNFDIVVSNNMYSYLEHLFYFKGRVPKLFMSLRNSPNNVYSQRVTPHIFSLKYYYAHLTCIGVSKETTNEMKKYIDMNKTNLITIYNPFDFKQIRKLSQEKLDKQYNNIDFFISVGGLNQRKRVDLTIKAFAKIDNKNIKLLIIGQGEKEKELKSLVNSINLSNKVLFVGSTDNPYKYMSKAKALIMTSESEGLPRVLIESLICGIPAISTDCPTGPREILIGELSNLLIPIKNLLDANILKQLTSKMNYFLEQPSIIIDNNTLDKYEYKNVINKWEEI